MRLVLDGSSSAGDFEDAPGRPAAAARQRQPSALGRRRRLLAALHAVLALSALALLAPRALAAAAIAAATAHPKTAGHDCPQYTSSILDLPDTSDCRRLMRLLAPCLPHQGQATVGAPAPGCCDRAATFFSEQCHCWGSQFDTAALLGVAAIDDACAASAAADDITLPAADPAAGSGGAAAAAEGGEAAARAAAAGQVAAATRLVEGAAADAELQQQLSAAGGRQGAQPIVLRGAGDGAQQPGGTAGAASSSGSGGGGGGVRLFVGVLSAAARREARDAIRATWGSHPDAHRLRFFLARPSDDALFEEVRREAVERRDLVVLGHVAEAYSNITHQTLEVLRFAAADPSVTHVLKVDDDSYVHWERLMHRLLSVHSNKERLFWGHIERKTQPQRSTANPWYVSQEEWPSERYPPWAHGAGYVLSADLAAEVASGAAYAASAGGHLFKLEDVALGSWLEWAAARGGWEVHYVSDRRFNFDGCRHGDLVSHYIKPPQMRCMWGQQGRCNGC